MNEQFASVREVAELHDLTENRITQLCTSGQLRAVKSNTGHKSWLIYRETMHTITPNAPAPTPGQRGGYRPAGEGKRIGRPRKVTP